MREIKIDKIFNKITTVIVLILTAICLMPFIHIIAVSLSGSTAIISGRVTFFPVDFSVSAYKAVIDNGKLVTSLYFTIRMVVVYIVFSMVMTILCAYPFSKKHLKGRKPLMLFILFTMYFQGGMIPAYLLINNLGMLNTFGVLIIPTAISTFNMIIMITFFGSIPVSLEESAVIDGANHLQVLIKIVLPLSMPAIATISLFYAVARWNTFMDALLYINNAKMYPLQLLLRQIISLNNVFDILNEDPLLTVSLVPESIKAASLIFSITPIMLVYPWLQKYFVKGVMIGSLKG